MSLPESLCSLIKVYRNPDSPTLLIYKNWSEKGIIRLGKMFEGGHLVIFQQLQRQYDPPTQDFYKY